MTGPDLAERLRSVPRPTPVLGRDRERALTARQRELLDQLGGLFDDGFAQLTMAEIARALSCSLRTLYELAPSRDELLLMVIDRNLWRIGRTAAAALEGEMAPLDALRAYLRAANVAVAGTTAPFARDLAAVPAALRLNDAHSDYLVAVTRCLLDAAVDRGDIAPVDTAAIARVMAGVGRDLTRPEVLATLGSSPKEAADRVVDVILAGLVATGGTPRTGAHRDPASTPSAPSVAKHLDGGTFEGPRARPTAPRARSVTRQP